jgi:hypothetical protein
VSRYLVKAEWIVSDRESALRLSDSLHMTMGADSAVMQSLPDRPEGFHRGCSREGCPCHMVGPVCEECMCVSDTIGGRYCPRCGWHHDKHEVE